MLVVPMYPCAGRCHHMVFVDLQPPPRQPTHSSNAAHVVAEGEGESSARLSGTPSLYGNEPPLALKQVQNQSYLLLTQTSRWVPAVVRRWVGYGYISRHRQKLWQKDSAMRAGDGSDSPGVL